MGGSEVLKRAREYRLFSRTILPLLALYTAGFVLGRVLYFGSGHLGLFWGPLGELRREVVETARSRAFPSSQWMDWFTVVLWGGFLFAELKRQQAWRVAASERFLLAGYSLASLCALSVPLTPQVPEALYGAAAVVAASLLVWARWTKWPRRVRVAAIAVAGLGAGMAVSVLRLRDMARLGRLR
jgi:hypothetical protein